MCQQLVKYYQFCSYLQPQNCNFISGRWEKKCKYQMLSLRSKLWEMPLQRQTNTETKWKTNKLQVPRDLKLVQYKKYNTNKLINVKNQHVTVVRSFCWLCRLDTSTLHRSPFTDQIKSVKFKAFQNALKAFGRPPILKHVTAKAPFCCL